MDFYYHDVPLNFPRDGRKKELFQAVGQVELLRWLNFTQDFWQEEYLL